MTPRFILPAGYKAREMRLVLSRTSKGWKFYGEADGYAVIARNPAGEPLCKGETFATKAEAAMIARCLDLPLYSIWSGQKRCYIDPVGQPFKAMAFARDHIDNPHNLPPHLIGMTQEKWDRLSPQRRDELRDNSKLSPQLLGMEGCRVEVVDILDMTRSFVVGKSTGWRPCHLELESNSSDGGGPADAEYKSVRILERVR